jgi:ribosome-associated toxin RatA of RatAB toxin-antitoxin module
LLAGLGYPSLVPEQTHSSILIAAEPSEILSVIGDVETYPEWVPGLDAVVMHEADDLGRPLSATFHGTMGLIKDSYTVAYDWAEDEVSWHLTAGEALRDLHGTYACTPLGDGTTDVEYRLDVELAIPVVGMLRRRGEKMIVDSALKGLKSRVEG